MHFHLNQALRDNLRTKYDVKSIQEQPRIVHSIVFPAEDKKNFFGQITVKIVIKRSEGFPPKEKDSPIYVVFEKHLVKPDARWRICSFLPKLTLDELLEKREHKRKFELLFCSCCFKFPFASYSIYRGSQIEDKFVHKLKTNSFWFKIVKIGLKNLSS